MWLNNNNWKENTWSINQETSIDNTTTQTSEDIVDLLWFDEYDFWWLAGFWWSEFESQKLKDVLLKYNIINDNPIEEDWYFIMDWYEAHYSSLKWYITNELQKLKIWESLPDDILEVSYWNNKYLENLSLDIDKSVSKITQSNSSELFNDISDLCDLLYLGTNYSILENYNSYNLDNIEIVMDKYNEILLDYQDKWDTDKFNYIFNLYTSFIDMLNRLCTLNSNDIQRKKTIQPILEIIKFKTNESKMIISYDTEHLNVLNNFMWKFMINFSHINYIDSNWKTADKVINQFWERLMSQTMWFTLCENNNFWNKPDTRDWVRYTALWNVSYLLLSLYRKLEFNFPELDISSNDQFNKVIFDNYKDFLRESWFNVYNTLDINTFKSDLVNNLIWLYKLWNSNERSTFLNDSTLNESTSDTSIWNVFNHFYYDNKAPTVDDMEIIHHLLLFNDKTDIENNLHLLDRLIRLNKFENDNLEFFKLKTIDLILNSINRLDEKSDLINHVWLIVKYIEDNNKWSLLLSAYSKIYISLALYFSDIDDEQLDISKVYYSKFLNINWYNLLESEYLNYHNRLLINYWKIEAIKQWQEDIKEDNTFLSIWRRTTVLFEESKEYRVKNEINDDMTKLVNNIMEQDWLNDKEIINTVENFISNKILLWISKVYLRWISWNKIPKLDRWYDIKVLPIHNEAKLIFVYPKFYKDTFDYIIQRNLSYLSVNIKNILLWYLSKRETYIDDITQLPNARKLLWDLSKSNNIDITQFYEIDIKWISEVNKEMGHKEWDRVFKLISDKLKKQFYQWTLYRLNWIRLWLLMNEVEWLWSFNNHLSFDNDEDDLALEIESSINNILKEYWVNNSWITIWIWWWKPDKVLINSWNALRNAFEDWKMSSRDIEF